MRQLNLQPSLSSRGALAEDFEDQAGAVDDFGAEGCFQIALLDRAERCIDDDQLDAMFLNVGRNRFDLTNAEQRGCARLAQPECMHRDHIQPDRQCKSVRLLGPRVKIAR